MEVLQLLPLITQVQTPLTIKERCHREVCMDSLLGTCHLLTLEHWEDQACHPSIDLASHLFMVGSHLSIRQLVEDSAWCLLRLIRLLRAPAILPQTQDRALHMEGRSLLHIWVVQVQLVLLLTMEDQQLEQDWVEPTILLEPWELVYHQAIHRQAIVSIFKIIKSL